MVAELVDRDLGGHLGIKLVPVSRADDIAQALWYVAPGCAELREEKLTVPARGDVRVRAWYGALSRGTERLGSSRTRTRKRIRTHASAVHGRQFPVSREIRLYDRRLG